MANLDRDTIKTLTKLSRIKCTEQEADLLLEKLTRVLKYVEQLNEVDVEDVEPCYQVHAGISAPMREDEIGKTLDTKDFLDNSPSHIGGMIRVPPVIKQ